MVRKKTTVETPDTIAEANARMALCGGDEDGYRQNAWDTAVELGADPALTIATFDYFLDTLRETCGRRR